MEDNDVLDNDLARVLDLLSLVKRLNNMIDLHRNEPKYIFMVNHYTDLKDRFLVELKEILSAYEIDVLIKGAAA